MLDMLCDVTTYAFPQLQARQLFLRDHTDRQGLPGRCYW
jgi:hypothetical protein